MLVCTKEMDLHANLFSSSSPGRKGMTLKQNAGGFPSEWLQLPPRPPHFLPPWVGASITVHISSRGLIFQANLPSSVRTDRLSKLIYVPAHSLLFSSLGSFAAALSSGKGPHRSHSTCTVPLGASSRRDTMRTVTSVRKRAGK